MGAGGWTGCLHLVFSKPQLPYLYYGGSGVAAAP